jgi:uncharacterized protein (DUF1800 family)
MTALSPQPAGQFDAYAAAHLLWRAGFGGTWEQATELADLGIDAAVDRLVNFTPTTRLAAPDCASLPKESAKEFEARVAALPDEEARRKARHERYLEARRQIADLKVWWLNRMLSTSPGVGGVPPLEEKLTLFWHSHFATGYQDKIELTFPLWQQNQTFRSLALARFPDQLHALIRDPAMLVWLDNASSHRRRPNENFARELMELFSTGVGPYSENDVKEAARALTGFSVNRDDWTFVFRDQAHDPGEKTFFGQSGAFSGDDIVRIICEQPATAHFMARKLLDYFVCTQPDEEMVAPVAEAYRTSGYDLKALLHEVFRSRLFYSDRARNAVVKSPVALAVGALKSMRVPLPPNELTLDSLRLMGQDLFFPPDVNGWPGGADWINSNTLLIRYNFANFLMYGVSPDEFKVFERKMIDRGTNRREFLKEQREESLATWSPRARLEESGESRRMVTSKDIADYYIREFLQRAPSRDLRDAIVQLAETDGSGGRRSMSVRDPNFDDRARGLVHLIMSSPDYQLS